MTYAIARRLRSLELKLIRPLARVRTAPHVDRLFDGWQNALRHRSRLPDPFRFMSRLIRSGVHPPGAPRATNYLDQCRSGGDFPDRFLLLLHLLFGPRSLARSPARAPTGPSP